MTNKTEQQKQIESLRKWFPKGSTVYLVLRHRSRSGMSRSIGVVTFKRDGKNLIDYHPNWAVATALGWRTDKKYEGIKVSGCGMDMGFHLVSTLAEKLYGDYKSLKHRWL